MVQRGEQGRSPVAAEHGLEEFEVAERRRVEDE